MPQIENTFLQYLKQNKCRDCPIEPIFAKFVKSMQAQGIEDYGGCICDQGAWQ